MCPKLVLYCYKKDNRMDRVSKAVNNAPKLKTLFESDFPVNIYVKVYKFSISVNI